MGDPATSVAPHLARDEARRRAATLLRAVSREEASLDARVLLEEATGLDRVALLRDGDQALGEDAAARLSAMLARRLAGEPVWRILGRREFWGLDLVVTPAVLDPRPDTETVVAAALEAFTARRRAPVRVLDLGVGSGAILCALLSEWRETRGWGLDRSVAACAVARGNADRLGFAERALIVNGDWGEALAAGMFDLVVSNPPYIETDVIPTLDRTVRDHDPHAALDGGPDGLDSYRRIVGDLPRLLAAGGIAVLELGAGQAAAVQSLLLRGGLTLTALRRDLGGHERAIVAGRPESSAVVACGRSPA